MQRPTLSLYGPVMPAAVVVVHDFPSAGDGFRRARL